MGLQPRDSQTLVGTTSTYALRDVPRPMHLLLMPRSRLIHDSSSAPAQSIPQPGTPADCSFGKAGMTSPHSRCPRAPMRTMNAATLRDDQMQFHSYWPKSVRAHPSYLCTGGMQEPSGHVMGGGRWGGIEAPNLPSCVMPAMTSLLLRLPSSHSKSSTNNEFQGTASALTSTRSRVSSRSQHTESRHCARRLFGNAALCILDTGQAPHPLIHRLHLAAHDPHPSVALKLGFAGCYWDLETRGTRDDVRTVAPTDPGWAADGRRRERLPLPRAYDKYYDVPPRAGVKAGSVTPTLTFLLRCPRSIVRGDSGRIRIGSETHGRVGGRAGDVGIGKEEPLGSGLVRSSDRVADDAGLRAAGRWRTRTSWTSMGSLRHTRLSSQPSRGTAGLRVASLRCFFPAARRVYLVVCGVRRMHWEAGHRRAEAEDVFLQGVDVWDLPALLLRIGVCVDLRSQLRFVACRMRRCKCCKSRW
ncbi:hypothetical protein B0H14DRAFT_2582089 [Mycena olivaceomarginata]|nr:hypothetical protein B0H14DRAFT_2582089 [Mycena olivaceomarginata]